MGDAKNVDAAAPLTSIMPRWLVVAFAVTAFALANVLLLLGLFWPEKFDHPAARFILCSAIALNLSLFFFVLYPQVVKLPTVPVLNLAVQLVGPVALYVVLLLLLLKLMPEPPAPVAYRFFFPSEGGKRVERLRWQLVTVTPSGEPFTYYTVPDGPDSGGFAGVCVKFESGKDMYKAEFKAPYYKPIEVVFRRGPGEGSFELERAAP